MNFEEKIKVIKETIEKLNNPEITLKDGMELYKNATDAIKQAQTMLENAKNEYEEIKNSKDSDMV